MIDTNGAEGPARLGDVECEDRESGRGLQACREGALFSFLLLKEAEPSLSGDAVPGLFLCVYSKPNYDMSCVNYYIEYWFFLSFFLGVSFDLLFNIFFKSMQLFLLVASND